MYLKYMSVLLLCRTFCLTVRLADSREQAEGGMLSIVPYKREFSEQVHEALF